LSSGANPGPYRAEAAASSVHSLRSSENVIELGAFSYRSLHHLYRACHIYVSPAYAESFAHPLVEAMSSGLPIVASDLPVHREICRDAATYFSAFSPEALAERVLQIQQSPAVAEKLSRNGLARSQDFRWDTHVEQLIAMAEKLASEASSSS
jgi:glycosyltransferase involved in cell wall biosynthesis